MAGPGGGQIRWCAHQWKTDLYEQRRWDSDPGRMWELLPKAVTVQSERRQRKGLTVVLWVGLVKTLQLK